MKVKFLLSLVLVSFTFSPLHATASIEPSVHLMLDQEWDDASANDEDVDLSVIVDYDEDQYAQESENEEFSPVEVASNESGPSLLRFLFPNAQPDKKSAKVTRKSKIAKNDSGQSSTNTRAVATGGCRVLTGKASYYGNKKDGLAGKPTASGEPMNPHAMTAAMLPPVRLGSTALVTCNGRTIQVLVNDRGPYVGGRIIDLSVAAATSCGLMQKGTHHVSVRVCGTSGRNKKR